MTDKPYIERTLDDLHDAQYGTNWSRPPKKHAPRDVYETREDYRCGICHNPVVRYSAPRAVWKHVEEVR